MKKLYFKKKEGGVQLTVQTTVTRAFILSKRKGR